MTAVALGLAVLAGCAQTSSMLDVTTGSLPPSSQTAGDASGAGNPPLPARRKPKTGRPAEDGGLLAALPDIDLSAQAVAPRSVVADDTPINVYVRLARQIRRCWLGPNDPRLPGHGFRAEANPGESGKAEIDVYKEVPGRKYGPYAFEVKISPQGGGSLIRSTNRRVEDEVANTLRADIARWARGGSGCTEPEGNNA